MVNTHPCMRGVYITHLLVYNKIHQIVYITERAEEIHPCVHSKIDSYSSMRKLVNLLFIHTPRDCYYPPSIFDVKNIKVNGANPPATMYLLIYCNNILYYWFTYERYDQISEGGQYYIVSDSDDIPLFSKRFLKNILGYKYFVRFAHINFTRTKPRSATFICCLW